MLMDEDEKLTQDEDKDEEFGGFMIGKKKLNVKMDLSKAESILAKLQENLDDKINSEGLSN